MTFKVYGPENGKLTYYGDVTAPSYNEAVEFLQAEGFDTKELIVTIKREGRA